MAPGTKFLDTRGKTCLNSISPTSRGVAQPGSALEWGSSGRWFKSSRPDHKSYTKAQNKERFGLSFRENYMLTAKKKSDVIVFPLSVFETADTKEDLEDWLLSQNPDFIRGMRKARQDDLKGRGKDWNQLKKELCIK